MQSRSDYNPFKNNMPERSSSEKTLQRLRKSFWEAEERFSLLEPGDHIMVCLSGGKDSYTLLDLMLHAQQVRKNFSITAVNLDQKQPGFPTDILPAYLEQKGVPYQIVERDTYSIVIDKTPQGKTMCSLCSRLRRGTLYGTAESIGATKIALGHHREDVLETFFLNLFFSGKLETMPAKYRTDDQQHVVIRPMVYCKEEDIAAYAVEQAFPIIPCNLCGAQENMQRKVIKNMLKEWEERYPNRKEVMMNALQNIHPSHLYDSGLFDFIRLQSKVEGESFVPASDYMDGD
ncbi:MAG: tRNA 2-thiocytidine(32) synthetase TtcA [Cytophagaceae bacterium]|nr:tRNA 2-thiocytidine(32) synthetase TtcA [Cytophagaceae bacterium]